MAFANSPVQLKVLSFAFALPSSSLKGDTVSVTTIPCNALSANTAEASPMNKPCVAAANTLTAQLPHDRLPAFIDAFEQAWHI